MGTLTIFHHGGSQQIGNVSVSAYEALRDGLVRVGGRDNLFQLNAADGAVFSMAFRAIDGYHWRPTDGD